MQSGNIVRILVISGPNLGLLGKTGAPGDEYMSLRDIEDGMLQVCARLQQKWGIIVHLRFEQTNHEGTIATLLEEALVEGRDSRNNVDGIIINPAALSYTSQVLADAMMVVSQHMPLIEVHLHNRPELGVRRWPYLHHDPPWGEVTNDPLHAYDVALEKMVGDLGLAAKDAIPAPPARTTVETATGNTDW